VLDEVATALGVRGASIMGAMVSPIAGADGNVEFVVVGRAPGDRRALSGRGPLTGDGLVAELDAAVAAAELAADPSAPERYR
jgi:hypothetical protein